MDTAQYLYSQNKYKEAEEAYRAWLTQYIIWHKEHTIPFVKDRPEEADQMLLMDIEAIISILYFIINCMYHQNKQEEIDPFLERASDIINDSRYELKINCLHGWKKGN